MSTPLDLLKKATVPLSGEADTNAEVGTDPLTLLHQNVKGVEAPPSNDPLGMLVAKTRGQPDMTPAPSTTGEFLHGVAAGATHPIAPFLGKHAIEAPQSVAGKLGEFAGFGVGFMGVEALMSAVGVPVALGAALGNVAGRLATDMVAGAAFESASGDPQAIITSAAMGVAFPQVMRGVGALWRGGFPSPKGLGVILPRIPHEGIPPDVHPIAYRIEKFMSQDTPDSDIVTKLKAIGDHKAQLDQAMVQLSKINRPGGFAIIPDVNERLPELLESIGKNFPGTKALVHTKPDGTANVLVAPVGNFTKEVPIGKQITPGYLMGGRPILTNEQFIEAVRGDNVDLRLASYNDLQAEWKRLGGKGTVGGFANTVRNIPEGYTSTDYIWATTPEEAPDFAQLMVHEYMHILTNRQTENFRHFEDFFQLNQANAIKEQVNGDLVNLAPENINPGTLADELKQATYWVEAYRRARLATPNHADIAKAKQLVDNGWRDVVDFSTGAIARRGYYGQDTELISRLAELMVIDPAKAKEVAPRASRMLASWISKNSAPMKSLLIQDGFGGLDDLFKMRWAYDLDNKFVTKWSPTTSVMGPEAEEAYKATGFFDGMSAFHKGANVELLKYGPETSKVLDLHTGKSYDAPTGELQQPLFPTIIKREQGLMQALQNTIRGSPRSLDFNDYVTLPNGAGGQRTAMVDMKDYHVTDDPTGWLRSHGFPDLKSQYSVSDGMIAGKLKEQGIPGVVFKVGNIIDAIIVGDPGTLSFGKIARQTAAGGASMMSSKVTILPKFEDVARSLLRQNGVLEKDIPYFTDRLGEIYRKDVLNMLDLETQQVVENTATKATKLADSLEQQAVRAGLDMEHTASGDIRLNDVDTGLPMAQAANAKDVQKYIKDAGLSEGSPRLDEDLPQASASPLIDPDKPAPEKIVAATVKWGVQNGQPLFGRGMTHADAYDELESKFLPGQMKWLQDQGIEPQEGFVTNTGRFISRNEAMELAKANGQYKPTLPLQQPHSRLDSYDTDMNASARPEEPNLIGMEIPPPETPPPQIPTGVMGGGAGGNAMPPKMNEQISDTRPGAWNRIKEAMKLISSPAFMTSMEAWSRKVEQAGVGPAWTKIVRTGQQAIERVNYEYATIKRTMLGNQSYNEYLHNIANMLDGVKGKDEKAKIIGWIEAMSRPEIEAPGGLLKRGMNANEIRIAKAFATQQEAGTIRSIPHLMALDRLANIALKGNDYLEAAYNRLRKSTVDPSIDALYQRMLATPKPADINEAYKLLNVSDTEAQVLGIINQAASAGADKFSIYAVSRWMSAKDLAPGFTSGRQMYEATNPMNGLQKDIAKKLEVLFGQTFSQSGMDAKRALGGYWPHMREWVSQGFGPETIPGLNKQLPDEVNWSALRFRTGELDPYSQDPLQVSFKHVRSMLMKQEFDPVLKDMNNALADIAAKSPRTARIMQEYMHEIQGGPHRSFKIVNDAIQEGARAMGFNLSDDFTRHVVNSLLSLTTAATIPFRPALILRNYYNQLQTIAPTVGMGYYFKALKYVTDDATRQEAYELATKGGAVMTSTLPVHGASELFAERAGQLPIPGASKLAEFLPKASEWYKRVWEKGYDWYVSPDDMGRAIAFHAQRMLINDALRDFQAGKISWDKFLENAKVKIYNPVDQESFVQMMNDGKIEDAKNYLGWLMARRTMFTYGNANHPAGWGSVAGRLFGQFGTWPVQYKDHLVQGLTQGTLKDRAQFLALSTASNVGVLAAGSAVGLNLASWVAWPSLMYSGGPYWDAGMNLLHAMGGTGQERDQALTNLTHMFPTLAHPQSIFVPGSYAVGDWVRAFSDEAPIEAFGFRVSKPGESFTPR